MAKQERQKRSTVSNQVAAVLKLAERLDPPFPLGDAELEVFYGVVASRERETWSAHDLRQAAKLARLEVQHEQEQLLYLAEGTLVHNERGTQIENPRGRACATIQNTIKSLSSSLGLTASQRGVAGEKQAKRNEFETVQQNTKAKGLLA